MTELFTTILAWFIGAVIVWMCWNALFPVWISMLPAITYWKAFALVGVARTLRGV